jgi:hypothetical protein
MPDHQRTAARIADVAWLATSRRAYTNWPVRLGALTSGAALFATSLQPELGGTALLLLALAGTVLAATGLVMGAAYGRVVAGLVDALEAGYPATWLTARVGLHEGDAATLAVELEDLAARQPVC